MAVVVVIVVVVMDCSSVAQVVVAGVVAEAVFEKLYLLCCSLASGAVCDVAQLLHVHVTRCSGSWCRSRRRISSGSFRSGFLCCRLHAVNIDCVFCC